MKSAHRGRPGRAALRRDLAPLPNELQPQAAAPGRELRRQQRAHDGRPAAVVAPSHQGPRSQWNLRGELPRLGGPEPPERRGGPGS